MTTRSNGRKIVTRITEMETKPDIEKIGAE
jgi:hypothetical protein